MYRAFPAELLRLVRCVEGDGALHARNDAESIENGTVRCTICLRPYRIKDGILRLLDERELDSESAHEATLRDEIVGARDYVDAFRLSEADDQFDQMEMRPTLAALEPLRDQVVVELGAGTGRYTVELVKDSGTTLAVDFSWHSLEKLAGKIEGSGRVGLVQADVTHLRLLPRSFDRVFSTLVSNLPTLAHREALYALAASALRDDGLFVFSAHRYGLRQWARHEPMEGRYSDGGIYRRLFTQRELLDEVRHYFGEPSSRPIQIAFPFTYRMGFPLPAISWLAERLPLVNRLGFLLLATARRPLHVGSHGRSSEREGVGSLSSPFLNPAAHAV